MGSSPQKFDQKLVLLIPTETWMWAYPQMASALPVSHAHCHDLPKKTGWGSVFPVYHQVLGHSHDRTCSGDSHQLDTLNLLRNPYCMCILGYRLIQKVRLSERYIPWWKIPRRNSRKDKSFTADQRKTLFINQLRARNDSCYGNMIHAYRGEAVLDLTKRVAGESPVARRCCLG